jgi:probable HAF family extracellular repeat protein
MAVLNRIRMPKDGSDHPVSLVGRSRLPLRLITLLSAAMALAMSACTSEETPTEPPESPGLARATVGTYTAVDLGTLPGGTVSVAVAINAAAQVVGLSATTGGENHAALWENGAVTDLGTLGGRTAIALAISNAGQVVGSSETAGGTVRAFLWKEGVMTDLGTPGGTGSQAVGINDRGQILLGGSDGSVGIWERGVITPLPLPAGSTGCTPTGLNAAGRAVGQCAVGRELRSVVWDHSGITDLGTLGGSSTAASAISASGRVVGIATLNPDVGSRPFLWQHGTIIDLSTQGAPTGFIPNAINAAGQIAGDLGGGGHVHAILWQHGTTIDLDTPPDQDSFAFGINASGEVVGHTGSHATLWTRK